jgi:uncharacterized membrane protein
LKHLTATFLRGLVTVLPVVLTLYILYWFAVTAERVMGGPLRWALPDWLYRPGLGIVMGVVLVFIVGLVMELYVARRLVTMGEQLLLRIPVVKTVYGAIKDFAGFISKSSKEKSMSQVVRVRIDAGMYVLGFVTRDDFAGLPPELGGPGMVAVYLPMSYQIGGYTVILPRERIEPIPMSSEEALRFAVTAGMSRNPV